MADGTIFEKRGIPTASITTDAFTASGNAMAAARGFPDYRYAMIPHPLSSLTPEQVKERAGEILPDLLAILGVRVGAEV
ncbi:MAG: hypothetical protein KGJ86_15430 [Chloroflexota bacterium]|nr:hypothetical protein [Chloroflexota bacterium]